MKKVKNILAAGALACTAFTAGTAFAGPLSNLYIYGVGGFGVENRADYLSMPTLSNTGIFRVNVETGASEKIINTNNIAASDKYNPNSLGYNSKNETFFFTSSNPNENLATGQNLSHVLYSVGGDGKNSAQSLTTLGAGTNYGGVIQNATGTFRSATGPNTNNNTGSFIYMQQGATSVRTVSFGQNGQVTGQQEIALQGFQGNPLVFGDVTMISDNVLFGSGTHGDDKSIFFTVDLNNGTYREYANNLNDVNNPFRSTAVQLAYVDGHIFGIQTMWGRVFEINPLLDEKGGITNFDLTYISTLRGGLYLNDASNGMRYSPVPEPMTALLVGMGALGVQARRRKKAE